MNIVKEKHNLRQYIKKVRKEITEDQKLAWSHKIFSQIESLDVYKKANTLLLYWSIGNEVHTHEFILKACSEKKILLPVTLDNVLELKYFKGVDKLQKSTKLGLLEPIGKPFYDLEKIDLALIPGMAFDKDKNRLGYGKGYYDKLLPKIKASKIGVCFNMQLLEQVPTDHFDVKMDMVIHN